MSGPPPDDKRPLPNGWIRQWDSSQNHHFYVDTNANPPRAIWTHPLDDPEYQRSQQKDTAPTYSGYLAPPGPPPPASQSNPEIKSKHGTESKHAKKDSKSEKRSAFGKLKDKLIGTKEEREAERQAELIRREEERLRREQMMQERMQRIQQMRQSAPAGYYQQAPSGGYYQQSPYGQPQYVVQQQAPQRGGGMGGMGGMGMGIPLLGGLAGGLLLGEALDAGDGGFDGGDGGGDFGGGGDF